MKEGDDMNDNSKVAGVAVLLLLMYGAIIAGALFTLYKIAEMFA